MVFDNQSDLIHGLNNFSVLPKLKYVLNTLH